MKNFIHLFIVVASTATFFLADATAADPSLGISFSAGSSYNGRELDNFTRSETNFTDTILSNIFNGAYTSGSISVSYGTVFAHEACSVPDAGDKDYPGFSGQSGGTLSCQDYITVNTLPGILGTARVTFRFAGDSSASPTDQASACYSVSVGTSDSTVVTYGNCFNDVHPPATFTADVGFQAGTPIDLRFQLGTQCVAGSQGQTYPAAASASLTASLTRGAFVLFDQNDEPVSYTSESRVGSGRSDVLAPGSPFNGLRLTNMAPGRFGSTVTLRDGVASAIRDALEHFIGAPHDLVVASDMVEVNGLDADPVAIQLSYEPMVAQSVVDSEKFLRLVWKDPRIQTLFNAVVANFPPTPRTNGPTGSAVGTPTLFLRAYNPATDFQLGNYGVDTNAHVVWAVVNHGGEFAVAHVEPNPLYLTQVSKAAGGHKILDGFGLPLTTYKVQSTHDLAQGFADSATTTVAANGTLHFDAFNQATRGFYRIVQP